MTDQSKRMIEIACLLVIGILFYVVIATTISTPRSATTSKPREQDLSCGSVAKAKSIGRLVFYRKFPDTRIERIELWDLQQSDKVYTFSVWYRNKSGKLIEGAMGVERSTCRAVIAPVF